MARKQTFLAAEWSKAFEASYARLNPDRQKACDKAIIALIKQESSAGLRVKAIHPDKYYNEARLDSGNRIVFRIDDGTIFFVDVIDHDKISRYGGSLASSFHGTPRSTNALSPT